MEELSAWFKKGSRRRVGLASKVSIALAATLASLFLLSGSALALFSFGLHGGLDTYTVSSFDRNFDFLGSQVYLKRDEIKPPFMFGAHFYSDLLPIVDLELSADAALRKYDITYINAVPDTTREEVTFARLSLCGTLKKTLIKIPPVLSVVSLYAGLGGGVHLISPVISKALILDKLSGPSDVLTPEDVLEDMTKLGGHALVGLKIKPPAFPLALNLDGKYTVTEGAEYEEPDGFFSTYLGLSFGF